MSDPTSNNPKSEFGLCPLCEREITSKIGTFEGHEHRFHAECLVCEYCHDPVQPTLAISQWDKLEYRPHHQPCREKHLLEQIQNKVITITQRELDDMNSIINMFRPNTELSPATNQQNAEILFNQCKWVHEQTLDEMFITLKRVEAIAVCYHILLSKDKKRIEKELGDRAVKQFQQVETFRRKQEDKKQEKHERLDPQAKMDKKAVKALMAIGLSEDEAIKRLTEMKVVKKVDDNLKPPPEPVQ